MIIDVTITETTEKIVRVETDSIDEAVQIARNGEGDIVQCNTTIEFCADENSMDYYDDEDEEEKETGELAANASDVQVTA